MPAEAAPHEQCWMAWPCRPAAFGDHFSGAKEAYARVARAVAAFEPVTMLANAADLAEAAAACGPAVTVREAALDDSWTRDTGPTFVVDGRGGVAGVSWRFNGWGLVYPSFERDALLADWILDDLGMRRYDADFVTEGGALHTDGEGTLLVVAPTLLDVNRNPGRTREDLEKGLCACLGAGKVIWLENGLEDDETAGHVDNVACFVRPGLVLTQTTPDPADENHRRCRENLAALRAARDAKGRPLEVIEIGQPAYRARGDGRLALSYINFYLANGAVIMPSFDDPQDGPAREALAAAFPGRRVVPVPVLDILHGGGGIHCITQQQPAGRPIPPVEA